MPNSSAIPNKFRKIGRKNLLEAANGGFIASESAGIA